LIICATGHRPDKLYGYDLSDIRYLFLKEKIKEILILNNCTEGISGMALGLDMIFALAVIDLKDAGYNIKLHCAIPCINHTGKWTDDKIKKMYQYILSRADTIHINSRKYNSFCMQERNIYMVDNSNIILAVYDGFSSGGTKNCIDYAISKNKKIISITPTEI